MILKDKGGGGYPVLDGKWPVRGDCLFLNQETGCHHLSALLSNRKRLSLAEVAGYAERS